MNELNYDFDLKLADITNKNLLVKVKDSGGKTYRFRGTGKQIIKDLFTLW